MSDVELRALERAAATDPTAEAALVRARLRAGGRDPRRDPRKDDVVDAPGPGARKRAARGDRPAWNWSGRRATGSGPLCRAKGRVVVAIWPQVLVAQVEVRLDGYQGVRDAPAPTVLTAGTHVRSVYYSASRDETTLGVRLPAPGRDHRDYVDVVARGRVEVALPADRLDSYDVEWAPVLYPETADTSDVDEAVRVLEAAGLPREEAARLRERLRPRTSAGLAAATIRWDERETCHIAAWREWAKRGTVRRIGALTG